MLVRSWSLLFGLLAFSALALAVRRNHYYDKRGDYADKGRNKDGDKKSNRAEDRSESATNKVSDSSVAQSLAAQNLGFQTQQDSTAGSLPSFADLLEFSKPRPEPPKTVKTYIVSKKVPVPYPVQYETRVPYPIKVPVRRPYAVYVPKPYYYEVPKPVPYTVKVPFPHPYHVEKYIPHPYKVPFDKPVPVHIAKPYPVYVEKKVPVPFEKEVPVEIKIPVERPLPVEIPVEKPVPVPVETSVLYPFKFPIENQGISQEKPLNSYEGTTTYEVNVKDLPQIVSPQIKFSSNEDITTPLKTNIDFSPSPFDSFSSSLQPEGKQQVISFVPEGNQNSAFQTLKHGYTFEPLTSINSHDASKWTQVNSTDWIPQFVNAYQTTLRAPEALKLVSSQNENEPKITGIETKHLQNELKREEGSALQQNQVYNFIPFSQKTSVQDTPVHFQLVQQNSQKQGDGNYQFYNVHPAQGSKTENAFSSISFQKFDAEPKSSAEPPTKWVQVQRDAIPQASYQQQHHQQLVQQNNKDVTSQQSSSNIGQQAAQNFIASQDYVQFKPIQNSSPTREPQQGVQQTQQNHQGHSQPEFNQFTNQNFPQLQQYQHQFASQPQHQQQISTQPQQYQQNIPEYHTAVQASNNYQNQQAFSVQPQQQYQQQQPSSTQENHQQHNQQLQRPYQQQQQAFQQDQSLNYHPTAPQQYHQQTQYHQQSPSQQFQNTFEQKQQLGEQDVKIFLGQGPYGHKRRQRQPSSQQVSQGQQLLTISPDQQVTTETTLTGVSSSTEHPQRIRKTRRRNRKRNNNNNNVETTTAFSANS